jgi:signal transduction histidine kinase
MVELQLTIIAVYFIYGLAFFSMGLAMALEVGRSPSLGEARILRPLAVFGIVHGLHEWYELILFQAQVQFIGLPNALLLIRLALLAISFVSLMAYGIQVIQPPRGLAAIDAYIGGGMLTLYAAVVFFLASLDPGNLPNWATQADVLARYTMAVPGSIMAGVALHRQSQQAFHDDQIMLSKSLQWATWGFFLYGVTQVFVPKLGFFPANLLNTEMFLQFSGLPIQVFRATLGVIITIALIRATQVIEIERQRELAEAQEARLDALQQVQDELVKREDLRRELLRHTVMAQEEERTRISRELHDELGQILTGFSLDLATLKNRCEGDKTVSSAVERLQDLSKQMSGGLYRLVHDLRPAQLDDLGLVPALQHLFSDIRKRVNIQIEFDVLGERKRLDPLVETVLFRVTQEALTNVIRHAQDEHVSVQLDCEAEQTVLIIRDLGVGFDAQALAEPQSRLGIAGMRERVRSINGQFILETNPGQGTVIKIHIPFAKKMLL